MHEMVISENGGVLKYLIFRHCQQPAHLRTNQHNCAFLSSYSKLLDTELGSQTVGFNQDWSLFPQAMGKEREKKVDDRCTEMISVIDHKSKLHKDMKTEKK